MLLGGKIVVSTIPPEPANPRLSTRCRSLLIAAIASTGVSGAWPVGDLIYLKEFTSPAGWWVMVLLSLAAWMTFIVSHGQDRMRADFGQRVADLHDDITTYGDAREANGVALSAHFGGQNGNRRLNPVE